MQQIEIDNSHWGYRITYCILRPNFWVFSRISDPSERDVTCFITCFINPLTCLTLCYRRQSFERNRLEIRASLIAPFPYLGRYTMLYDHKTNTGTSDVLENSCWTDSKYFMRNSVGLTLRDTTTVSNRSQQRASPAFVGFGWAIPWSQKKFNRREYTWS